MNTLILITILSGLNFRLKEIETSIRSQVAAEKRAHDIVERLVLEDFISEDFLINSVTDSVRLCSTSNPEKEQRQDKVLRK